MHETFDPYYKWLGIPRKDQPPHHYRLLGIELFESDPDVIDASACKQTAYVKGCANGPHAAASQKLLNEIATARLCLLSAAKKAAYDADLRGEPGLAAATVSDGLPWEDRDSGFDLEREDVIPAASSASGLEWIADLTACPADTATRLGGASRLRRAARRRKGPSTIGMIVSSMGGVLVAFCIFKAMGGTTEAGAPKRPSERASQNLAVKSPAAARQSRNVNTPTANAVAARMPEENPPLRPWPTEPARMQATQDGKGQAEMLSQLGR